jgi:hypothetical protein
MARLPSELTFAVFSARLALALPASRPSFPRSPCTAMSVACAAALPLAGAAHTASAPPPFLSRRAFQAQSLAAHWQPGPGPGSVAAEPMTAAGVLSEWHLPQKELAAAAPEGICGTTSSHAQAHVDCGHLVQFYEVSWSIARCTQPNTFATNVRHSLTGSICVACLSASRVKNI